jgi:hypothetical protein
MRYCVIDDRGIGRTCGERSSSDLHIADSVGTGGANRRDDVRVVQSLLNVAYDRLRTPPRTIPVDGFAGPDTLAAIRQFQRAELGSDDGLVDPAGTTIARLNVVASAPPRMAASARAASLQPASRAALDAVPLARTWVEHALTHLRLLIEPGAWRGGLEIRSERFHTVNTHFHLDRNAGSARAAIALLITVFERIEQVFAVAPSLFRDGGGSGQYPVAETPLGGFHLREPALRAITFRSGFAACGPNTRAALLLHASAHFVGDVWEIGHFALEFPAPEGIAQEGGLRNYRELTPAEALRNASSYTAFAIHAATGRDERFGARDTSA